MERPRVSSRGVHGAGLARAFGLALTLIMAAGLGVAQGQDSPPRPAELARYVPKHDNLFFYFEFDGLDAHLAAWKNSAAYKLLNDTKLGALIEDVAGQAIGAMQQSAQADKRVKPTELIGLAKLAARQGFAAGFWGVNPAEGGFVVVARGAGRPEIVRLLEAVAPGNREAASKTVDGRNLRAFDREAWWWVEKGDLVLSSRPETVVSTLEGGTPNVAEHPVRVALRKGSDGFEPLTVGFLDIAALPPMPPQAVQLGLDGLKRLEIQWGIQDDAMLTVLSMVAPQPRRGLLELLDQPTFAIDSLPPLPAGLTGFGAFSINPDQVYGQVVELSRLSNPGGGEGFAQLEQALRQRFGFDLRKDILAHLGPKFAVYSAGPAAGRRAIGGGPRRCWARSRGSRSRRRLGTRPWRRTSTRPSTPST